MIVEVMDTIVNDFFNHVHSYDDIFYRLDRDLQNLNAFTYHRISMVHVNK